jgi:SAM-dependent methyltransferase
LNQKQGLDIIGAYKWIRICDNWADLFPPLSRARCSIQRWSVSIRPFGCFEKSCTSGELITARSAAIPGLEYLSGDLAPGWAMEQMDITDIHYPDQTFDVIYCSHVLEHVPEDRKAIAEFYRVLKPGGWALIIVPINRERTYEDLSVTGPEERRKIFGHPEHVRHCGQDYAGRLRSSGFHVTTEKPSDYFDQKQFKKYGLKEEPLFFCEKK